jgi:excisionase family DNA binding protein
MDNTESTWLNTRQAAARLAVTARELYRLVDVGDLPAYKHGRDLRLRHDDVERYAAERAR